MRVARAIVLKTGASVHTLTQDVSNSVLSFNQNLQLQIRSLGVKYQRFLQRGDSPRALRFFRKNEESCPRS